MKRRRRRRRFVKKKFVLDEKNMPSRALSAKVRVKFFP